MSWDYFFNFKLFNSFFFFFFQITWTSWKHCHFGPTIPMPHKYNHLGSILTIYKSLIYLWWINEIVTNVFVFINIIILVSSSWLLLVMLIIIIILSKWDLNFHLFITIQSLYHLTITSCNRIRKCHKTYKHTYIFIFWHYNLIT
jgi:hypothetical protein